jgi:hypothetical protein
VLNHVQIQEWIATKHHEEWVPLIAVGLFWVVLIGVTAIIWTVLELARGFQINVLVYLEHADEFGEVCRYLVPDCLTSGHRVGGTHPSQ